MHRYRHIPSRTRIQLPSTQKGTITFPSHHHILHNKPSATLNKAIPCRTKSPFHTNQHVRTGKKDHGKKEDDQWEASMREMKREIFGEEHAKGNANFGASFAKSSSHNKSDGPPKAEEFYFDGMKEHEDWFDEEHYARHFSSYEELKRIRKRKTQDGGNGNNGAAAADATAEEGKRKTSTTGGNPYLSALRQFFLMVHPDFFHENAERQNVNSRSFQQLNELMNWVNKLKNKKNQRLQPDYHRDKDSEAMLPPPFHNAEFKFHVKPRKMEESASDKEASKMGKGDDADLDNLEIAPDAEENESDGPTSNAADGVKLITARFELNDPAWKDSPGSSDVDHLMQQRKDLVAELSVDRCMISLLTQAGIEISPEVRKELQSQRDAFQRIAHRDAKRGVAPLPDEKSLDEEEDEMEAYEGYSENIRYLREEFRLALKNNLQGQGNAQILMRREGKDAAEEKSWWDSEMPTVDQLIDAKQLYFSKQLTPQQSMAAIHRLRATIHDMQHHKWRNNPIIFTDKPELYYTVSSGSFIHLPCAYSVDKFNEFIDKNEEALREKSRDNLSKARTVEALIAYVKRELKLHELELHCNVDDAIAFLQRVAGRVDPRRPLSRKKPSVYVSEIKNRFPLQDMILRIIPSSLEAEGETADTTVVPSTEQKTRINLEDGALEFKCDLTGNQVLQFLDYCGRERLDKSRKLTKTLTDIRERCIMLGDDLVKSIGCREIDITSNGVTADGRQVFEPIKLTDKLKFLQELEKVVARLQVYDWRNYRFIMVSNDYFKTTSRMTHEIRMARAKNDPEDDYEDDELEIADMMDDMTRTVLIDNEDGDVIMTINFSSQELIQATEQLYHASMLEEEGTMNPLQRKTRLGPNEMDEEKLTLELFGPTMKLMSATDKEERKVMGLQRQIHRIQLEMEEEDERKAQEADVDDTVLNDPEALLDENDWELQRVTAELFKFELGTIKYGEWEKGRKHNIMKKL